MEFRIADTFTDSLSKLTGQEQKVVKTTAFDLQMNPINPGMQFHRIDKVKDPNFWSVRVNSDIRLIVHKTDASLLLCYVDHHDKAYRWAEQRKLETHPRTGAAQMVVIRETIKEIEIPKYVEAEKVEQLKPLLLERFAEDDLLKYGVPLEWLVDVLHANEDTILDIADHLPAEAAEAVLELATGGTPSMAFIHQAGITPFDHPDAQRRFRVMNNVEELERALEFPWEKWTIFLHPTQKDLVEKDYNGPVRISGSAGTGKTIIGLHRAVFLAKTNPDARVLLTTFSETLANVLRIKLRRLICNQPRIAERLEVYAINEIGERLYKSNIGTPNIATNDSITDLLKGAASDIVGCKFSPHFLLSEWSQVVDAWHLYSWEAYRDVLRLGRKTRLSESHRAALWSIFEQVRSNLQSRNQITCSDLFYELSVKLIDSKHPPFDYIVIDEAQDISVAQLRFLAAIGGDRANSLMFTGDLGQRIFQQPFSWKALGVDIRGRSHTLKVNYRTSHQIRTQADRLLGPEISDVDGVTEDRRGTISVFNGPAPTIIELNSQEEEIRAVSQWLLDRSNDNIVPHEIGLFVRSEAEIDRGCATVKAAKLPYKILDERAETTAGYVSISTMHLAKGLEFKAVVVMACDDEIIPLQERIEVVSDDSDLDEVYNTERHLLYVACTRARDHLLVSGVSPVSEFLDDIKI